MNEKIWGSLWEIDKNGNLHADHGINPEELPAVLLIAFGSVFVGLAAKYLATLQAKKQDEKDGGKQ